MRGRRWTEADDAMLRTLHARGLTDAAMAPVMGILRGAIGKHRRLLGLPTVPVKRGGWTFSAETRARFSAAQRERWRKRWRRPPKGTPERRLYNKLRDALGAQSARAAFNGSTA